MILNKNSYLLIILLLLTPYILNGQTTIFKPINQDQLPNGEHYSKWEKQPQFSHTYYVSQKHPQADDQNPGTKELPFLTISRAADLLQPGERVLIHSGNYRETIRPARGGTSADKMITYEAVEGEKVKILGSIKVPEDDWKPSQGWNTGSRSTTAESHDEQQEIKVWQLNLHNIPMENYNPFGMLNLLNDQTHLDHTQVNMRPYFKKRGLVWVNGVLLEQVLRPVELMDKTKGAYWTEHNGLRIHVRFPENASPTNSEVDITIREQLFAPLEYGLGYIKIKGIHFKHSANGFPVPQRGMVSTSRGHHWIIEDCILEGANSLAIDLGNEMWHTTRQKISGYHIFRRNIVRDCGISGLQAETAENFLVEDNLFENIGWHNAEHAWESGAIKLHRSKNTLIRRNLFRNIIHAPGVWLDYLATENCRITNNVFTGITSARGAVYIEVSRNIIEIDHNVFHNTKSQYWISGAYGAGGSALYTDGSDSIRFHHNLAFDIENTGFGAYANPSRIVAGRGGTDRDHQVTNNIFINCGKHGIEFPNTHHFADFNVYANMPPGYLKLKNPEPELLLNLQAWQDYYGWELNGKHIRSIPIELNPESLLLKFDSAFLKDLNAGPFSSQVDFSEGVMIDPRKK